MSSQEEDEALDQRTKQHNFLQQTIKSRFQILAKLGSGAYGHVWKVKCRVNNQIYAIKKIFMAFENETDAQRVYREITILKQIHHNNVVNLLQVLPSSNKKDIYLLFESMESDVFKAIKNRVLDQNHKKYIVYQLACALKYIHSAGILHRDLKPSNILINSNCQIKVCDFGLSRTTRSEYFNKAVMTEFVATRWYRSPEIIFGSKGYNSKSDMWSLGCLIYQLYSRRTLLPGENVVDQISKLIELKGKPTKQEIEQLNAPKAKEILQFFDVQKKPIQYYYDDLQCQEVKQVLNNLFVYDPSKRWSAEQLLDCKFLEEFRHSQPQEICKSVIALELNDNRRYKIERYEDSLLRHLNDQKGKEANFIQKRDERSVRNSKPSYNIHTNSLSKLLKHSLNSVSFRHKTKLHKKYQSSHVSPANERATQKCGLLSGLRREKSIRSTISSFRLRSKQEERPKEKCVKMGKGQAILKRGGRSSYLSKQKVVDLSKQKRVVHRCNKQNEEKRMKVLKKIKVKYNQSAARI